MTRQFLAADLDLQCNSGPAPLIFSPPIDVSKFNEAFYFHRLEGPARGRSASLYRKNRAVDLRRFPRRLLHSVVYSLVTTEPVAPFAKKAWRETCRAERKTRM